MRLELNHLYNFEIGEKTWKSAIYLGVGEETHAIERIDDYGRLEVATTRRIDPNFKTEFPEIITESQINPPERGYVRELITNALNRRY